VNRTILITGGSRGLGLVMARQLVSAGARVAICGRDQDTLDRASDDLNRYGGPVLALRCDMRIRQEVERLVERVAEHLGPLHALVNNAGTIAVGPLGTMGLEDFEDAMATNFWGPLYAILAVLPDMRRRGWGRIVNVASIGGMISVPHLLPYSASKFALVGLSEGLRAELLGDGVEVSTICPGLMRTGSPRHALFKGRHRAEYAWFNISDSLPMTSMSAERAAGQIIEALRSGKAGGVLSVPANLGALFHGVFPSLMTDLLAVAHRWLPEDGPRVAAKGEASTSRLSPSWLTVLGERAARRYNQVG
jgi:NAD(P)-dependent dehydrogenase (short-subunit alcohol dehydrogenase family)